MRVLTEPKNSLVDQFKQLFKLDGVELELDEEALTAIAGEAVKRGTGARGLRSIVEALLLTPMYEIPGSDVQTVIINKEVGARCCCAPGLPVHRNPVCMVTTTNH